MQQTQLAAYLIATPPSSLPIEPSVWYVSSATGGCDWSEPATAISFPYARRQGMLFQLASPQGKTTGGFWEHSSLLKENSMRKSHSFVSAFLPPCVARSHMRMRHHTWVSSRLASVRELIPETLRLAVWKG